MAATIDSSPSAAPEDKELAEAAAEIRRPACQASRRGQRPLARPRWRLSRRPARTEELSRGRLRPNPLPRTISFPSPYAAGVTFCASRNPRRTRSSPRGTRSRNLRSSRGGVRESRRASRSRLSWRARISMGWLPSNSAKPIASLREAAGRYGELFKTVDEAVESSRWPKPNRMDIAASRNWTMTPARKLRRFLYDPSSPAVVPDTGMVNTEYYFPTRRLRRTVETARAKWIAG